MGKAFVSSRRKMSCSNEDEWFNSEDFIAHQLASADAYKRNANKVRENFEDMLKKEAINRSYIRKITCNMFFISFLLPRRGSYNQESDAST